MNFDQSERCAGMHTGSYRCERKREPGQRLCWKCLQEPPPFVCATSAELAEVLGMPVDKARQFESRIWKLAGGKPVIVIDSSDAASNESQRKE